MGFYAEIRKKHTQANPRNIYGQRLSAAMVVFFCPEHLKAEEESMYQPALLSHHEWMYRDRRQFTDPCLADPMSP